jgi:hypothetical protein
MANEILNESCIYIDDFRSRKNYKCKFPDNEPLFFLTHSHVDHSLNANNEKFKVICSTTTAFITGLNFFDAVIAGKTYEINRKTNKVTFTVFNTLHSPGSCGFYFHFPINVLHVGDSRIDATMIKDLRKLIPTFSTIPLQIYTDPTKIKHKHIETYPTMEWSRNKLLKLWQKTPNNNIIIGIHSDSISLLLTGIFTPIEVKNKTLRKSLPELRPSVSRAFSMLPKTNREIQVCGRFLKQNFNVQNNKDAVFLEPSMLYFVNDNFPKNVREIYVDARGVKKLFFGTHASKNETNKLKKLSQ